MLLRPLRRWYIDEVGVCEASRLAAAAIDSHTDVEDVANLTEEI